MRMKFPTQIGTMHRLKPYYRNTKENICAVACPDCGAVMTTSDPDIINAIFNLKIHWIFVCPICCCMLDVVEDY